jgi:hypothetical protein
VPDLASLFIAALPSVLAVVLVLTFDFVFRMQVYDRSDPLSLSLLSFSAVLIVSETLLKMARGSAELSRLLPGAFLYIVLLFIITLFAQRAHRGLQEAQRERVRTFLQTLRSSLSVASAGVHPGSVLNTQDALWTALVDLGNSMLEPDLFRQNPKKRKKRIEFLHKVRDLTGAVSLDPLTAERELTVSDGTVKAFAGVMYNIALIFGLLAAVFFGLYPFAT